MSETLQILAHHGYGVVFSASLLEQMGLPVPAMPILLAVGALSRAGGFSISSAILAAVLGSLTADLLWYALGRHHGHAVLGWVCGLSATPNSCVERTKNLFGRHGSPILLVSKFLPGFSAAAIPLAGAERMHLMRFLFFDGAGAALWAGSYMTAGFAFSSQLERVVGVAASIAMGLTLWIALALALILAWKHAERRALLRRSREV